MSASPPPRSAFGSITLTDIWTLTAHSYHDEPENALPPREMSTPELEKCRFFHPAHNVGYDRIQQPVNVRRSNQTSWLSLARYAVGTAMLASMYFYFWTEPWSEFMTLPQLFMFPTDVVSTQMA